MLLDVLRYVSVGVGEEIVDDGCLLNLIAWWFGPGVIGVDRVEFDVHYVSPYFKFSSFHDQQVTKVEVKVSGLPNHSTVRGCVPIRCGTKRESSLRPKVSVTPM